MSDSKREQMVNTLAETYFKFLKTLDFNDTLYMKAIGEGKRKFLANLHIHLATRDIPIKNKLYSTDFVTEAALVKLMKRDLINLEYEHLVPKTEYVQNPCEEAQRKGILTLEFVRTIIDKYLWTATVTEEEHGLLSQRIMPLEWDQEDIKARYKTAGVVLLRHDLSYLSK